MQFKQAIITGVLFAAFCESLHLWIPYRSFSGLDFVANICGLTIGILGVKLVQKIGGQFLR
jgi:VanZ family protein